MRYVEHSLGNKDGVYTVSFKDKNGKTQKAEFKDVVLSAPGDIEALEDWHKAKTFKVGSGDEQVTFTGIYAAAAAKVLHDVETVRGKAREKLSGGASVEAVGTWLRNTMFDYTPGKQVEVVVQKVEVSEADIAKAWAEGGPQAVAALLAKQGATVTPMTDEERIAAAAQAMADAVDARLENDEESDEELSD